MATKKKPLPRISAQTAEKSHTPNDALAKPPPTQVTETAKALDALAPSKPALVEVARPATPISSGAPVPASPESPSPATATIPDGPVESVVARIFKANPDRGYTINAIIAELKRTDPVINENSVRFTITELKRKSIIHHVRNEGYYQILKFTKPGEGKPFPRPPLPHKPNTRGALKASPADVASDLAVLKEATAVIVRLQALVHRNQEILSHLSKLRSVL